MEDKRYIITGIDKNGERKEVVVKERPNNIVKNLFAYLYRIKVIEIYEAKLNFLEKEEI